ncbi:MAG: hypothetical protein AAFS07_19170, partial [Pseudomonadota bacterium]
DHPRLHAVLPNVPLGRTTAVETAASILNPPRPTRSSDDAAVQRPPEFVPSLSGADQALLADLLARIDALRLAFPGLACRAAGVRDLAELSSVRVQAPFRWVSAAAVHSLATYQRQQQALQELMVAMANNLQASGGDVSGAVLSAATHPQFDDAESAGLICRLFGLLPVGSLAVRAVLRALPRATATDFDREHLAAIESWSAVVDHRVVLHRLLDKLDSLQHDRLLLDVGEAPPRAVVGAMCHWFRELRGVQDEDRRLCVSCLRELQLAKQRAGDLGAGDLAVLVDTLRRYADAAAVAAQAMEAIAGSSSPVQRVMHLNAAAEQEPEVVLIANVQCCARDLCPGGCAGADELVAERRCPLVHVTRLRAAQPELVQGLVAMRDDPNRPPRFTRQRLQLAVRATQRRAPRPGNPPRRGRGARSSGGRPSASACPNGHCLVRHPPGPCHCASAGQLTCGRPAPACPRLADFMRMVANARALGIDVLSGHGSSPVPGGERA